MAETERRGQLRCGGDPRRARSVVEADDLADAGRPVVGVAVESAVAVRAARPRPFAQTVDLDLRQAHQIFSRLMD